jgi:hypothetical protein
LTTLNPHFVDNRNVIDAGEVHFWRVLAKMPATGFGVHELQWRQWFNAPTQSS